MFIVVTAARKMGGKRIVEYSGGPLSFRGASFPHSRHASAKMATRQHLPLLSPRLCQFSGASLMLRQFLWRKSRKSVALPLCSAIYFGDNLCKICHTLPIWIAAAILLNRLVGITLEPAASGHLTPFLVGLCLLKLPTLAGSTLSRSPGYSRALEQHRVPVQRHSRRFR
jgi:hypothetical protein